MHGGDPPTRMRRCWFQKKASRYAESGLDAARDCEGDFVLLKRMKTSKKSTTTWGPGLLLRKRFRGGGGGGASLKNRGGRRSFNRGLLCPSRPRITLMRAPSTASDVKKTPFGRQASEGRKKGRFHADPLKGSAGRRPERVIRKD